MGRKKTGLDRRILESAGRLFYAHGYPGTGINRIIEAAGTNKPGLYTYFKSKDELVRRYLEDSNAARTAEVRVLAAEASDVPDFFRRWMALDRASAAGRRGEYYGCPVANFALQSDATDPELQAHIRDAGRKWEAQLVAYLRAEIRAGRFEAGRRPGAAAVARRMLGCLQGAITMWKLTGRLEYFDEAARMFEASLA